MAQPFKTTDYPQLFYKHTKDILVTVTYPFYEEDGRGLKNFSNFLRDRLPHFPGIYIVTDKANNFVYIGMTTKTINIRWQNHHVLKDVYFRYRMGLAVELANFHCIPEDCCRVELRDAESWLLRHTKQLCNTQKR